MDVVVDLLVDVVVVVDGDGDGDDPDRRTTATSDREGAQTRGLGFQVEVPSTLEQDGLRSCESCRAASLRRSSVGVVAVAVAVKDHDNDNVRDNAHAHDHVNAHVNDHDHVGVAVVRSSIGKPRADSNPGLHVRFSAPQ